MPITALEDKQLEWKNLIEQKRQSGLPVDKWCLQNQIRPSTFQYWKDKLERAQLGSKWLPLPSPQ